MNNKEIIQVWTTPISPALEESFKFQRDMIWVLGIGVIILIQLMIWGLLK